MEDPSKGTALVRSVKGSSAPDKVTVVFRPPTSRIKLSGQPPQYFNKPRAGEALTGTFPVPLLGREEKYDLDVRDDTGGSLAIPLTVKHED